MADLEKIRVLIVDDVDETRDNLAKLLGFEPDIEIVGSADSGQEAIAIAKRERPSVILMDINMPPGMDGITATEIIANTVPESPIIMMSVQGEQDYLRRSMLAGAREFLVKGRTTADEMVSAIRNVNELERSRRLKYAQPPPPRTATAPVVADRDRGKVLAFFSPKGGVGRTTIATNLAVALHQSTGKPVCLVDGSLPFGDVGVILNVSPKAKTIADLVGSFESADAEVLESVLFQHSTGVKVLLAPPTPETTELISGAQVKHVIEVLRERYAYVIVDTWPSFQEAVLAILDTADVILTLMTLELASLKNVRVFLEVAKKLGYDDQKVQLVANRSDSSGGIKIADIEVSLGKKIGHTIVSDGLPLVLSVNRGTPFVITYRDSKIAQDVFALAARLSGDADPVAAVPERKASRQGFRRFAR
ncbi:MAG: response regulator [Chloroflexota bacterium]|nr:response regulator [Chloroflexota bacterium]